MRLYLSFVLVWLSFGCGDTSDSSVDATALDAQVRDGAILELDASDHDATAELDARMNLDARMHLDGTVGLDSSVEDGGIFDAGISDAGDLLAQLAHLSNPTYCTELVQRGCERSARCTDSSFPVASCIENSLPTCERSRRVQLESVAQGRMTFDHMASIQCFRELEAMSCGPTSEIASCQQRFSANVVAGHACHIDSECSGDTFCAFDSQCPGTCRPRGGNRAFCENRGDCRDGFLCVNKKCRQFQERGEPCSNTLICSADDYCGEENRCVRRRAEYETCDNQIRCENSLHCKSLSGNERECRTSVQRGGACRESLDCSYQLICQDGICERPGRGEACEAQGLLQIVTCAVDGDVCHDEDANPDTVRTCAPRLAIGATCSIRGSRCQGDARCYRVGASTTIGQCLEGNRLGGEACYDSNVCRSRSCVSGLCAPPRRRLQFCSNAPGQICEEGLWCEETCREKGNVSDICSLNRDSCRDGLRCSIHPDNTRRCEDENAQLGEYCFGQNYCASGLVCIDNRCETERPDGQPCVWDSHCVNQCWNNVCASQCLR